MLKDKPHIAIYMRYITYSGAHRAMLQLASGLVKQGFRVDLVFNLRIEQHMHMLPDGVQVFDLKSSGFVSSLLGFVNYLRKEQPLATFSTLYYADTINILAKLLTRGRNQTVVSVQNTVTQEIQTPRIKARFITLLCTRFLYFWADGIVAVSKGVAQDLANFSRLPLERIKVIYNPVLSSDVYEKAKDTIEHPWFYPGERPIILGVGRLEKQKDFPNLIHAFAQVLKTKKVRLVILGWGADILTLEALVTDLALEQDVAFLGAVDNPYAYMARSAVFVLSSKFEGFGNVLVEAMAVGTPVVSTNCPHGPAEILNNGEYGELVPVSDSNALAKAILEVLDGKQKTVDAAWLNQFSLTVATKKYLDIVSLTK
jgi:glycosyltransferase involved in cell wall biosynthesis